MKKIYYYILLIFIILNVCSCAENNSDTQIEPDLNAWIDAYYTLMESGEFLGVHIYLLDIDFDGTPELFLSTTGTGGTWIAQGYSYKDGNIIKLQLAESIPSDLELYKNIQTGELVWIASGMFRGGAVYRYDWREIDFSNLTDVRVYPFFTWKENLDIKDSYNAVEYQLIDKDLNVTIMTIEEIEAEKQKIFSEFEQQSVLKMFSFCSELASGTQTGNTYDYDLFYTFLKSYDTAFKHNNMVNFDNQDNLPVSYIHNQNLYNYYQLSEPWISLVRKGYVRIDVESRTNIHIGYIEISRLHDENLRQDLNQYLKEWAFFDWNVQEEERLKLQILQSPTVYKNYLSIGKWTDCHIESAAHPWCSLSAVVFDINTGQQLKLTDIIIVDERIKEKIYAGKFYMNPYDRFTYDDCIEFGLYDQLNKSILRAADSASIIDNHNFYLSETGLVFIIGVPHVMGDYAVFKISYTDLEDIWCGED